MREHSIELVLRGRVLSVGEFVAVRGLSAYLPLYEVLETDPMGFDIVSENTEIRLYRRSR